MKNLFLPQNPEVILAHSDTIWALKCIKDLTASLSLRGHMKLSKTSSSPLIDATKYRSLVGSLRYLPHTRPDLAYSVGYVSRFMESPREEHLVAVKRILRYVAGTLNAGVRYKRHENQPWPLGFSDSDMAGDVDDRKSTSGVIFFFNGNTISWQSCKQKEKKYLLANSLGE